MTQPEVTAVITSFNQRQFIVEAVESVIGQQGCALETIVVDDGSDDGTAEFAESFCPRIRVIRAAHGGVAAARNIGWQSGHAELIAFLDGDDAWLPEKLMWETRTLRDHPEAGLVYADSLRVRADGTPIDRWSSHMQPVVGDALLPMLRRNRVHTSTVVMRREVLQELGGFDEGLPGWEDIDVWTRAAATSRYAYIPRVLSRYRMHGTGISQLAMDLAFGRLMTTEKVFRDVSFSRISAPDRRAVMADVYIQVATAYYLQARMPSARQWLLRAWHADQGSVVRGRSLTTFAKSLAGPAVVGWLRSAVRSRRIRNRSWRPARTA